MRLFGELVPEDGTLGGDEHTVAFSCLCWVSAGEDIFDGEVDKTAALRSLSCGILGELAILPVSSSLCGLIGEPLLGLMDSLSRFNRAAMSLSVGNLEGERVRPIEPKVEAVAATWLEQKDEGMAFSSCCDGGC